MLHYTVENHFSLNLVIFGSKKMNLTLTWQWVVMMVQRFVNWLVYTFWIYSKKSLALTCFGLYRDDGLGYMKNLSGPESEKCRKKLIKLFNKCDLKITSNTNLSRTDFLDITLDLDRNIYKPFRKPNNDPLYIHNSSNHPPSILTQIPEMIQKRVSSLSCKKGEFNKVKPSYERALESSGVKGYLHYTPNDGKKRNRKRNVTWFNPPFNSSVESNIGKIFLNLVIKHFPPGHKYHKIFNRNNLKISYSCMQNMEAIIKNHNKAILLSDSNKIKCTPSKSCNCRKKDQCPMDGNCLKKCLVYKAVVETENDTKSYIGCCETAFKTRFSNHKLSFNKKIYSTKTELSKHIWNLKDNNREFKISWSIIAQVSPNFCKGKRCNLCLTEKLLINKHMDQNLINSRDEILNKCRHKNKFRLKQCT